MAYVIGSDKGKEKAESMKAGETYTASDGSTWKKNSDGTVSVTTKSGNTYNNAYTPASNGVSSGGSSGGSKSSNIDYGTIGTQQVMDNADWRDVEMTLNSRVNKALSTPGLEKYAYDDKYWLMYNYVQDQKNPKPTYEEIERPAAYQGKYDPEIDALLQQILNFDDFSYNVADDPLYQQYKAMYQREGDRAMRDTMAEAAAGAGGMNSYAITAASQANNYYNSLLNDKIPELYRLAKEMYLNDKESKVQDLGILQNMDATQYNRYRDTMNDFYADRNFAYGMYRDDMGQYNTDRNFNYNSTWDRINYDTNNYRYNTEYTDNRADIEYERNQAEKETAYNTIADLIERGVTSIDPELMAKAGLTQQQVDQMVADYKTRQTKAKSSGGSGGGGNGGNGGDEGKIDVKSLQNDIISGLGEMTTNLDSFAPLIDRCEELYERDGKEAVLNMLGELYGAKEIDTASYLNLCQKFRDR